MSFAQQLPCQIDIPVSVVLANGGIVRGLNADAFVARSKDESTIQSVTTDSGPRRVLFLVETDKHIPAVTRKIETTIISSILAHARADDRFALLTAHGPREEVKFGSSPEALRIAVDELGKTPKGKIKYQQNGVLDSVLEATSWFQPPQPGDAIVLMTMGIESPHKAKYSQVRDTLVAGGIRLFGFQLGQTISGSIGLSVLIFGPGGQYIPPKIEPNLENVFALSGQTGGVVVAENTVGDPQREYEPSDKRLQELQYLGVQMYKAVAEYYRLRLKLPARDFVLDLADPARKDVPMAALIYPTRLPGCAAGTKSTMNP